jgi:hypothetical protein
VTDEEKQQAIRATEEWFEANGLPYFVASNERRVRAALRRRLLIPVVVTALVIGAGVALFVGLVLSDVSDGIALGAVAVGVQLVVYAFVSLHFRPIMKWAAQQTFGSLSWLFPLVTRALPLLLLFMTFLFINTEVWQVSSALERGYLWLTVMLFAGIATAFLLVRLPEEVRDVSERARGERLVGICDGTPLATVAGEVSGDAGDIELTRLQKANLILVMLFAQGLQVLLLSLSVFAFFIVFGLLAIKKSVIQAWLGSEDSDGTAIPHDLPSLGWLPVSNELFQVSVFLAAFAGLYFTVYAVTDENYRRQFFTGIAKELENAVGAQRVYLALLRR